MPIDALIMHCGQPARHLARLLVRFGVERLLYRLSQSRHADRFLLKGAMLFALWDEKAPRPTQDVDFLAFGSTELDDIAALFREIVETPVIADGLVFQSDSIRVEQIREADAYGGVRVRLLALLGKGEITLQIDLGSGDVVTPAAEKADFPALLDFPTVSGIQVRVTNCIDRRPGGNRAGRVRAGFCWQPGGQR